MEAPARDIDGVLQFERRTPCSQYVRVSASPAIDFQVDSVQRYLLCRPTRISDYKVRDTYTPTSYLRADGAVYMSHNYK